MYWFDILHKDFDGRPPLMEDELLMKDFLQGKQTFDGIQKLMEDDL